MDETDFKLIQRGFQLMDQNLAAVTRLLQAILHELKYQTEQQK